MQSIMWTFLLELGLRGHLTGASGQARTGTPKVQWQGLNAGHAGRGHGKGGQGRLNLKDLDHEATTAPRFV